MLIPRVALTRRSMASLDASPSRIPVLLGESGAGRTTHLLQLRDRLPRGTVYYVDVERTATTPERFLARIAASSPFPVVAAPPPGPRAAFDATVSYFRDARAPGGIPATFLLDEFLELQTFESFPKLRHVLHEFIDAIGLSPNRFVLGSRYTSRTLRLLRDAPARFEIVPLPPLSPADALELTGTDEARLPQGNDAPSEAPDREYAARAVAALGDGRPAYIRLLAEELIAMRAAGGGDGMDAVGALAAAIAPGGRLSSLLGYTYELRLHRARGYGALKAILEILSEEDGLKLTDVALRLRRTPGSTKDYLSWLEDVDLVVSRRKRYSIADPLMAVWVRLYCRASAPADSDVAREVHRFALPRLPQGEPQMALTASATPSQPDSRKEWGIIEID